MLALTTYSSWYISQAAGGDGDIAAYTNLFKTVDSSASFFLQFTRYEPGFLILIKLSTYVFF